MRVWCCLMCLLCGIQTGWDRISIPTPVFVKTAPQEEYVFGDKVVIALSSDELKNEAEELRKVIKDRTGKEAEIVRGGKILRGTVCLKVDAAVADEEGYELTVNASDVCITGKTAAGVFLRHTDVRPASGGRRGKPFVYFCRRCDDYG